MMRTRQTAILLTTLLLSLILALPGIGESDRIIVDNADAVSEVPVSISQDLVDSMGNVGPRFVVQYANAIHYHDLEAIPSALETLLGQVLPRFIISAANANRAISFSYPIGLVGDDAPPQISGIMVSPSGASSVIIVWFTDEYADTTLRYGTQPGVYIETVSDPLYYKRHEVALTDLTLGTTYYYQISSTDRSGNTADSPEYSFTAGIYLRLPLILR